MSLDDELRRRLQQAADQAGAGTDPAALTRQVTKQAAVGARPPLRLLGAIGAAGLVAGGALGFTALQPSDDTSAAAGPVVVAEQIRRSGLYDCPSGAIVGDARPGDRLFAVGRIDDGSWLAVRAVDGGDIRWLPATALATDDDRELPTLTCTETIAMNTGTGEAITTSTSDVTTTTTEATTTTTSPTTTVPATAPPTAAPTVPPTAPPDAQAPVISQSGRSPAEIYDGSWSSYCAVSSTLTIVATDNVGVTQVSGTYGAGLPGSPVGFVKGAGNTWTATFGPFVGLPSGYSQAVSITVTARDAAGNTSTSTVLTVTVNGTCLI